jgi:hypothetical protein
MNIEEIRMNLNKWTPVEGSSQFLDPLRFSKFLKQDSARLSLLSSSILMYWYINEDKQ